MPWNRSCRRATATGRANWCGARRGVRRGGAAGRRLLRRRSGGTGPPTDAGAARRRALLRRERGVAADHPRAVRRPRQPRARPGAAQAVLRLLRLRAPGGGGRRHRRPLARAPAQLPADTRAVHAEQRQGGRGSDAGGAAPSHARRALALEPQPRPRAAPDERRQAPAHPSPADGGRRPVGCRCGRVWPPARRMPRPGRSACPTTCWRARRSTTACTRGSPWRGWWSCGPRSSPVPSRCTRSSRRSLPPSPTPS